MSAALVGMARSKAEQPADFVDIQLRERYEAGDDGPGWFQRLQRAVLPSSWRHQQDGFQAVGADEEEAEDSEEIKPAEARGAPCLFGSRCSSACLAL